MASCYDHDVILNCLKKYVAYSPVICIVFCIRDLPGLNNNYYTNINKILSNSCGGHKAVSYGEVKHTFRIFITKCYCSLYLSTFIHLYHFHNAHITLPSLPHHYYQELMTCPEGGRSVQLRGTAIESEWSRHFPYMDLFSSGA